jgi:hypothetical protein
MAGLTFQHFTEIVGRREIKKRSQYSRDNGTMHAGGGWAHEEFSIEDFALAFVRKREEFLIGPEFFRRGYCHESPSGHYTRHG